MEEDHGALESDACGSPPSSTAHTFRNRPHNSPAFLGTFARFRPSRLSTGRTACLLKLWLSLLILAALLQPTPLLADALDRIRQTGQLRYGSDMEGGGPYAYPEPSAPGGITGFEVELIEQLSRDLHAHAEFSQGPWDKLLQVLDLGRVDLVINGYELTDVRARSYRATRPYYVFQLQLMVPRTGPLRNWAGLKQKRPGGGRWKVGVLSGSAGDSFADEEGGPEVEVVRFDGSTDAMMAVQNGQCDATLQDLPAARFYQNRFPQLVFGGPAQSRGYYVIYVRHDEPELRDALDHGIERLIATGELKRIYDKYGIWTEEQEALASIPAPIEPLVAGNNVAGWELLYRYQSRLLTSAKVTVLLSISAMPLAMAAGLLIAIGRLYANRWISALLHAYVELIRGTPLMLQLFVLFYLLKLPPWVAGISGLAINYSAYEAEIYRAGLQAIPRGQMEAALALGMSKRLALRRVIIPQAVRIVIPPVTNDFIALFKDTSVCSVVTLVELTKEYSILANSTGGAIEFAIAAAALYMVMSVPLSWFSQWSERYLSATRATEGALI